MTDLSELYQAVILDHNKNPRNCRGVDPHNHQADGYNPLCGDQVHIELRADAEGRIEDIGFRGEGCAICMASASIMTESLIGQTLDEAQALFARFHDSLIDNQRELDASLGKLGVLAGVRDYPMRVKCATLAWHTLRAALNDQTEVVAE